MGKTQSVVVIGSGFAGLSAATSLAQLGYKVTLLEKNDCPGGRARRFDVDGFVFDMGPSWYWMPDVFDRYFKRFGKNTADYYQLDRLDPSYRVVFGQDDAIDMPASLEGLKEVFDSYEPGSGKRLAEFLEQSAYKYEVGINNLVYKPSRSVFEFTNPKLLYDMVRMDVFQSFHKHVRKYFSNEKLLQLVEFPILFLGAVPQNTPALYSLMNYADMSLGTWYPVGGMYRIVEGMVSLAKEMGVKLILEQEVKEIEVTNGLATKVHTQDNTYDADIVVAGADYHHVDSQLLAPQYRNYTQKYWDKRTMAPSSLLFYLGVNKKIKGLLHHNLFFDRDFAPHAQEIYTTPQWPTEPLFYVSVVSKTDPKSAPQGCENVFLLMPVAPGLEDTEEIRGQYYDMIMDRLETLTGESIREHVVYKRSYAHRDFIGDYHAFKGNAYGLANTLQQTAILKPGLKSKKVRNLYYTGQLTVPGPGVPPSLISGQVVAQEVAKEYKLSAV